MSNRFDLPNLAWGIAMGVVWGFWLRGTLDALFLRPRRMGPPQGSYGPRLDPGSVQRGNGHGGPRTAKPQFPSPRIIREDFLP